MSGSALIDGLAFVAIAFATGVLVRLARRRRAAALVPWFGWVAVALGLASTAFAGLTIVAAAGLTPAGLGGFALAACCFAYAIGAAAGYEAARSEGDR